MDAEFVNAYILRQKNLINDLMAKLLVAETQLEIDEKKINSLSEQNNHLLAELEKEKSQKKTTKATNKEDPQGF
jgi:proteasome assembly chaperone (PAC2) family protein